MSDSETDREADASHVALLAGLSSLRELLAERDERLANSTELIRDLRNEIRLMMNLRRCPDLEPSGLAASARGGKETPASRSSGVDRSKKDGKGSKNGRGPECKFLTGLPVRRSARL